jgi:hypothetical protein
MTTERGVELARLALGVFRVRAGAYPDGVKVRELQRELELAGHPVDADNAYSVIASALNASQPHGLWARQGGGLWLPGDGVSKMKSGLFGRALAEALHAFVKGRYPGRVFDYEAARLALEATGVKVKGTGRTTRGALARATDLFEHLPGQTSRWRWK